MITSAVHRGLIYSGQTPLASTIRVEQTAAMQLTVRAGLYTGTDGVPVTLATDQVFTLSADPTAVKQYEGELGIDAAGVVEVLLRSRILPDRYPPVPDGWRTISVLICTVTLPPGTIRLDEIPIHVLTIRSGFPLGTGPADWRFQGGTT